jgi:iron complex outermembrane recepter protein
MLRKSPLAAAVGLALTGVAYIAPGDVTAQVDEIVITGTRIRPDVYTSSTPMDVISAETGMVRGVSDLGTLLQTATVAAGSPQVTAASSTAFVQDGGPGARTLSLRGLGPNRTLVLLNNRRAGPAGVRGGVSSFDFNVLPLVAIDRVEILKDGASSIYGSDAVAGVVNIFTRRQDGGTVDAYAGRPSDSGGEESRVSLSWGQTIGRGHFQVTGDFHRESELRKGQREHFACGEQFIFDPDGGQRVDVVDPRTGRYRCSDLAWGHNWAISIFGTADNVPSFITLVQYDYDGDLGNFIPPVEVDPGNPDFAVVPSGDWYFVGYDRASDGVTNLTHPFYFGASLTPQIDRSTVYMDGGFDFGRGVQGYAELLLNRRETKINDYRQFWQDMLDEDFGNSVAAGWSGFGLVSPTPVTDHADQKVQVDYQRYVVGLAGDLGSSWNWDVSAQLSRSDGDYHNDRIYNDAIFDADGNEVNLFGSCVGQLTAVRGIPCIDLPWFDPQFLAGNFTPEVRDFLFGREAGNTVYTQRSLEGFVSGQIGSLPAGPVGGAFGIQYTRDRIRDVPGELTLAANIWGSSSAGITAGNDTTKALFAEFQVPLLTGRRLVERLSLNASTRYTDVDSYGSDTTYKLGLSWHATSTVRIRANKGTSFRSPALFELFLADQTGFLGQALVDPCRNWGAELAAGNISQRIADNCAAEGLSGDFVGGTDSAIVITGGGFGVLEAETSKSSTVGVVWQPAFADLSISLDYFDIEVKDEVDKLSATSIVRGCYNSEFFPNDPLCGLFERGGAGNGIETIRDSFINVAKQKNRGYDLSLLYGVPMGWGSLTFETQHTYQTTNKVALFEDTVRDENGELGNPKWVGRLNVTADIGPWSAFWGARLVGPASSTDRFGGTATYRGDTVRVVRDVDRVIYHSFSGSRTFDGDFTVRLGVANAFNKKPPQVSTLGGVLNTVGSSAFYSQYDWFGRRVFMNLSKNF